MIDIHSHILPMIDDGAKSVEEALRMLEDAYNDGTDEIVLTPHLAYEYGFINPREKITAFYNDLKLILKDVHLDIHVHLGTEFLFSSKEVFEEHLFEITKMNDTLYLLMEFFFDVDSQTVLSAVDCVCQKGFIPIIAHPERYECFQTSNILAKEVVKRGALLQMNKGSLFGTYGHYAKETVFDLLDDHLISFVGSDAHSLHKRTARMYDAYCYVRDIYGLDYAKDLFQNNARKMLEDIDIREREKHEEN